MENKEISNLSEKSRLELSISIICSLVLGCVFGYIWGVL